MKKYASILLVFVLGVIVAFLFLRNNKQAEYFNESESKYNFEETVAQLQATVNDYPGWTILKSYDLQQSMKKHDYNVQPVMVFSLCNPNYSSKILFSNKERIVTSMMPCRVSIYMKSNGKTYISRMNSAYMASQMGGLVAKVMSSATNDIEEILEDLIKPKN